MKMVKSQPKLQTLKEIDKLQWVIVLVIPLHDNDLPLSKLISNQCLNDWKGQIISLHFIPNKSSISSCSHNMYMYIYDISSCRIFLKCDYFRSHRRYVIFIS